MPRFNKPTESVTLLVPEQNGVKVFLAKLPEIMVGDDGTIKLKLSFSTPEGAVFNPNLLDPYTSDEQYAQANFDRICHLLGAFMTEENYAIFTDKSMETESFTDLIKLAESLYDSENLFTLPLEILVGYNKKGYLTFPTVGSVISSKYKQKALVFTTKSNLTLTYSKPAAIADEEATGGDDEM